MQVDAVEQRAGDTRLIILPAFLGARPHPMEASSRYPHLQGFMAETSWMSAG
jgi:hypothetical protein